MWREKTREKDMKKNEECLYEYNSPKWFYVINMIVHFS